MAYLVLSLKLTRRGLMWPVTWMELKRKSDAFSE